MNTPKQLRNSYRQSREAKNYPFPERAAAITTYKDTLMSSLAPCPQVPEQLEKDITAAVNCGNERVFYQSCDTLVQWFQSEGIQNAVYIRMCVLSMCFAILRDKFSSAVPVPFSEVTVVFPNSKRRSSGIPCPLSYTSTCNLCCFALTTTRT